MKFLIIDLLLLSLCVIMIVVGIQGLSNHTHECPNDTKIFGIKQQMISRTKMIKKLGLLHDKEITFILEGE